MRAGQPTEVRVLLVEDDEDDAVLTRDLLDDVPGVSYRFRRAASYEEGLADLQERDFDVCLVDYHLGGRSGLDLLREARERGVGIPFVLLTGRGDRAVDLEAQEAGASDYLPKSELSSNLLERSLRYAITQARDMEALRTAGESLREALARAREHEEFIRKVLETAEALVMVLDREGRVVRWNATCEKVSGYTAEELQEPGAFTALVPEEEREEVEGVFASLVSGEFPLQLENHWVSRSGRRHWIAWSNTALLDRDGEVEYVVGTGIDLTEKRELAEQLFQSQKMEAMGRLAGGIAHDFNSLLTLVLTHAGFLEEDLPPESPSLEDVEEIRQAARRAEVLTRRLLGFGRPSAGDPQPLDLNTVVRECRKMLGRALGSSVELAVELEDPAPAARADRTKLEQVLLNLVLNARDAMPGGGTITIRTGLAGSDEDRVLLEVVDTGHGMDAATRERIFEPFFTTKPEGRGTGLGLAVVYGLVHSMEGDVTAESTPGEGSRFRVRLPRAPEPPTAEAEEPPSEEDLRGEEVVLVLDDDPRIRESLGRLLGRHGYQPLVAGGAEEALRLARENADELALVVSDLVMPDRSGPDVVRELREILPGLPVLYVSAYGPERGREECPGVGEAEILRKPYAPEDLLGRVRALLGAR